MTNEQFWRKLDNITNKKQTFSTTQAFLKVLAEGYSQELNILILGVENPKNKDFFNQNCIIHDGKKGMLYFTDERHVKNSKLITPVGSMYQSKCMSVYICDVINNAIEKDEITSLIFNQGTKNMYVIPKILLAVALLGYGDLPM